MSPRKPTAVQIATARQKRVVASGGRRLELLLQPQAAKDLAALMQRDAATAVSVVSAALRLAASSRSVARVARAT